MPLANLVKEQYQAGNSGGLGRKGFLRVYTGIWRTTNKTDQSRLEPRVRYAGATLRRGPLKRTGGRCGLDEQAKTGRGSSFLLALPGLFWLIVFFLVPLVFVLVSSFFTRGIGGAPAASGHVRELHPHL